MVQTALRNGSTLCTDCLSEGFIAARYAVQTQILYGRFLTILNCVALIVKFNGFFVQKNLF